jgi:hypothetical protein
MKEIVYNEETLFVRDTPLTNEYNSEIHKTLKERYGIGKIRNEDQLKEVLLYLYEEYCIKFSTICAGITDLDFYQLVFTQHEQLTAYSLNKGKTLPEGITPKDIALYRRILKWILEEACIINLSRRNIIDEQQYINILEELYCLGEEIFVISLSLAEMRVLENSLSIEIDESFYTIVRNDAIDAIFMAIEAKLGTQFTDVLARPISQIEELDKQLRCIYKLDTDIFFKALNSIYEYQNGIPFLIEALILTIQLEKQIPPNIVKELGLD